MIEQARGLLMLVDGIGEQQAFRIAAVLQASGIEHMWRCSRALQPQRIGSPPPGGGGNQATHGGRVCRGAGRRAASMSAHVRCEEETSPPRQAIRR
ncbi:hypothetical protein [Nocardia niwae]|uniref:Uncharacterized protein n=1 Tax=Nocardia niwae TaxID=626084 RepID=A0ABV2X630_9NOCA